MTTREILNLAQQAKKNISLLTTEQKNKALLNAAEQILFSEKQILEANEIDLKAARGKISTVMLDRLALNHVRIEGIVEGLKQVAALDDPVNRVLCQTCNGALIIKKVSVPLGVVAIIYESRPNVTADAAALCLKSGNVCVLRCGKEAHNSAAAIVKAMQTGLKLAGVDERAINLIEDLSRESANELMTAVGKVDLLIPRGGAGLIKSCVENAKVPCIQTGTGICHVYVDGSADFKKALKIIENAKCSRPSVCNAEEVCLVDKTIYKEFLPELWKVLVKNREINPVTLKLDDFAFDVLKGLKNCERAEQKDFDTEFLDYVLAVKIVDSVEGAISHIAEHSTNHSEAIVTENSIAAQKFCNEVDSAAVYVNCSTRFTDGGEFGLGCEMGISTQKLHARGPMGLCEMTSYKYVVTTTDKDGSIR